MKKASTALSLILVFAILCMLLAACAKTETTSANETSTDTGDTAENQVQDSDETTSPFDPDAPSEVIFWLTDGNSAHGAENAERIQSLMNEITEPLGISVQLSYFQFGDYATKVQTAIAGGERIDLLVSSIMNSVPNLHRSNMTMDITDLMAEYAPDTLTLMDNYLTADTYDGKIYGVPIMRDLVSNHYLVFQKDLLAEAGLVEQAEQISSWSELEAVMEALTDYFDGKGIYAFIPSNAQTIDSPEALIHGDLFADIEVADTLGDTLGLITCGDDGKVQLYQATDSYQQACAKAAEWMANGWIYPDSIFDATQSATSLISQGVGVIELCASEYGVETVKKATYGADAMSVMTNPGMIKTAALTTFGLSVPVTAEEPEAAVYFLNLLYTNEALERVMVNGEEGTDYELVDGQAKVKENGYNLGNYLVGNNFLTLPIYGNGADFYDQVAEINANAKISSFLGFTIKQADLELVISQLSAVTDQYKCSMQCGGYTEEYLQEYLTKLDEAGVDEYISTVQAQLDAWVAEK